MYVFIINNLETGSWITVEIMNIPWVDDFLDLTSEAFKEAKYLIERSVSHFNFNFFSIVNKFFLAMFFFIILTKNNQ